MKNTFVPATFISNIKETKVIPKNEENELIRLYFETRDLKYRNKVIMANSRFIIKMAIEFKSQNVDIADVCSEGMMGLAYAIDKFDLSKDVKFVSYGVYWARHFMRKYINESSLVKIPSGKVKLLRKKIVDDDLAGMMKDMRNIMAMDAMHHPISMDSKMNDDSKYTIAEIIEDTNCESPAKEHYGKNLSNELVDIIVKTLTPVQADIIMKTYGLGNYEVEQTLRDISQQSHYSHERVRQLRKEALRELKQNQTLKEYKERYDDYASMK